MLSPVKRISVFGLVYGRLKVLSEFTKNARNWCRCICECGNFTEVPANTLRTGNTRSCGCLRKEGFKAHNIIHNMHKTRLYHIWHGMKSRCSCKTQSSYPDYGGRGITYTPEWEQFEPFRDWAYATGYADELTIERKDVNGNYEPDNCEWILQKDQGHNTRRSVFITAFGETKTATQWSNDTRCTVARASTIVSRLKRGWSPEDSISVPPMRSNYQPKENENELVMA